jgi:hypothetical protein
LRPAQPPSRESAQRVVPAAPQTDSHLTSFPNNYSKLPPIICVPLNLQAGNRHSGLFHRHRQQTLT